MGQVYRARDTRLGREVALKLMGGAAALDGPQLTRFEQEARLTGSLNHPNVVVVFDVGSHEGTPYLVTELLQGETLRHRMDRGRVPIETALDWAIQVARGLAAAHSQGVIHRDVKPENIFVTRAGHVKLLDFGIAKLVESGNDRTPHDLLHSTLTPSGKITGEGQVVGTPRYMSPEQIHGGPVDARTDLFSLGTVLYEMVTGTRAFPGNTVVEAEYAILHTDPPTIPAGVPPAVAQLLRHCLEKDPDKRFQSATDLAFHLDAVRTPSGSILATPPRIGVRRWGWLLLPLSALMVAALALAIPLRRAPRVETLPSVRRLTFRNGTVTAARFGPDRRTVFFSATWNGEPEEIYSTTTENPDYHPLGVRDARLQAVSSSGEVAILLHPRTSKAGLSSAVGTLAVVPGVGGVPREVAEDVTGASWAPDGLRMAITRQLSGGYRLEFPIGTTVYESKNPVLLPRLAPTGGRIAFVERRRSDDARGDVIVLEPGGKKSILVADWEEVTDVAWTPAGNELWFSGLPTGEVTNLSLWAVSLHGDSRLLYPASINLRLEDVGTDGRAIARDGQSASDIGVIDLASGSTNAHLAWFDWPTVAGISADGKSLLLYEQGDAAAAFGIASGSTPSWVFLQRTDGAPAVRLGPGNLWASPPTANGHSSSTSTGSGGSGCSRRALGLDGASTSRDWSSSPGWPTSRRTADVRPSPSSDRTESAATSSTLMRRRLAPSRRRFAPGGQRLRTGGIWRPCPSTGNPPAIRSIRASRGLSRGFGPMTVSWAGPMGASWRWPMSSPASPPGRRRASFGSIPHRALASSSRRSDRGRRRERTPFARSW